VVSFTHPVGGSRSAIPVILESDQLAHSPVSASQPRATACGTGSGGMRHELRDRSGLNPYHVVPLKM
jgi:hypothetical protein